MAYWYTYPATDSETDSDQEEKTQAKTFEQIQLESSLQMEFFEKMGQVPYLYQFADHSIKTDHWLSPLQYQNPLDHFYDLVDQDTVDLIKQGVPKFTGADYRTFGLSSWDKDQLQTIFNFAKRWIEIHDLGRNNYLNNVCWVAAKIIRFQLEDHRLKYPFKGVSFK